MKCASGTRRSLSSETIRVALQEDEGFVELTMEPSENSIQYNETHHLKGIAIDFWQYLGFMLDFPTPQFTFVDSFFPNSATTALSDATWNQTSMGLLHENKTDIIGIFLFLLPVRSQIANALWPLSNEKFEVYFRQPEFTPLDYNPYTKEFSTDVAVAVLFLMAISAILLVFVHSLSQWDKLVEERWKNLFVDHLKQLYDTLFWTVGTWCQQGSVLITFKWQARLLMLSVNNFFVFMYILYCALIIATLTQEIIPVKRVDQLFLFRYTFFAAGDLKSRLFVGNETNLFWNPPASAYHNYDDEKALSIQRIFTHRHAHLDTPDLFYSQLYSGIGKISAYTKNHVCDVLSFLPFKGGNLLSGMYARKGFVFRTEFNHAFSRIREVGIGYRVLRNFEAVTITRCPKGKTDYQEDLGMSYVGPAFACLVVLYVGAGFILIFEFCLHRRRCNNGS